MRGNKAILAIMVLLLLGVFACKSVETTSAMLHNQTGNYDKAIEMANLAIEKNPLDAEAHFQLGISYSYTGNMKLAYEFFSKSLQFDSTPKRAEIVTRNIASNWANHFNLGIHEFEAENPEGAAKEFKLATEADPKNIQGWLNLTMAYWGLAAIDSTYYEASFESADVLMSMVTEADDEYSRVLTLSGQIMIVRNEEEKAIEIFERLLAFDPTKAEAVESVGDGFLNKKEYGSAIGFYRMAIEAYRLTETENVEIYYSIGACYHREKRYQEAANAFQQVIAMEPENQNAHYSLLLAYYQGEFLDEVIMQGQLYTTEIAPDDPSGWQILGLTYSKKNMKMMAEKATEKYLELINK